MELIDVSLKLRCARMTPEAAAILSLESERVDENVVARIDEMSGTGVVTAEAVERALRGQAAFDPRPAPAPAPAWAVKFEVALVLAALLALGAGGCVCKSCVINPDAAGKELRK